MNSKGHVQISHLKDNTFLAHDSNSHAVLIDSDSRGAPCPTELLLMALGACCSTDLVNGLKQIGGVVMSCDLTTHETLRQQSPRIYSAIELDFTLGVDGVKEADVRQILDDALAKYCHVCLMLGGSIQLSSRFTLLID